MISYTCFFGSMVAAELASQAKASCHDRTRAQSSSSIGPGARGVRWQAELLKGSFRVITAPNQGTEVVVRVPLPAPVLNPKV